MAQLVGLRQNFQMLEQQFYSSCEMAVAQPDLQKLQFLFNQMQVEAALVPKGFDCQYAVARAEDRLHTMAFALFCLKKTPDNDELPLSVSETPVSLQATGPIPLELLTHSLTFASDAVHSSVCQDYNMCNAGVASSLADELKKAVEQVLELIAEMERLYSPPIADGAQGVAELSPERVSLFNELENLKIISSPEKLSQFSLTFAGLFSQLFKQSSQHVPIEIVNNYIVRLQKQLEIPLLRHHLRFAIAIGFRKATGNYLGKTQHDAFSRLLNAGETDAALLAIAYITEEKWRLLAFDKALSRDLTVSQLRDTILISQSFSEPITQNRTRYTIATRYFDLKKYAEGFALCQQINLESQGIFKETLREEIEADLLPIMQQDGQLEALFTAVQAIPPSRLRDVLSHIMVPDLLRDGEYRKALILTESIPDVNLRQPLLGEVADYACVEDKLSELYALDCELVHDMSWEFLIEMMAAALLRRANSQNEFMTEADQFVLWGIQKLTTDQRMHLNWMQRRAEGETDPFEARLYNIVVEIKDRTLRSEAAYSLFNFHMTGNNENWARSAMNYIEEEPWQSQAERTFSEYWEKTYMNNRE